LFVSVGIVAYLKLEGISRFFSGSFVAYLLVFFFYLLLFCCVGEQFSSLDFVLAIAFLARKKGRKKRRTKIFGKERRGKNV